MDDDDPFERIWPLAIGVSRKDVAYCFACLVDRRQDNEFDDLPDWAVEKALATTDEQMEWIAGKMSEHVWDQDSFYFGLEVWYCEDALGSVPPSS